MDSTILLTTLRPRQNNRYFPDDIFKCIFLNENLWIWLKISLNFVPKVRISNIPALVHLMAWRRPGDKPLSEPMMVRSTTHICVTRPQWVKKQIDSTKLLLHISLNWIKWLGHPTDAFAASTSEFLFLFNSTVSIEMLFKAVTSTLSFYSFFTFVLNWSDYFINDILIIAISRDILSVDRKQTKDMAEMEWKMAELREYVKRFSY